ncbi:hypothetical protein PCIT_b0467 [Pseudoalteromonas citrea]|uniref:Uncharacterized protein n=1 Tax=Pseudoalteromonas citrea TaxID=43655 RepID=A0AAD4FPX0_9GAMM|nr:hypothetical protein PCIT_b0467 [Pseudoalteromonas citrea]
MLNPLCLQINFNNTEKSRTLKSANIVNHTSRKVVTVA